jgi:hypothetical protein
MNVLLLHVRVFASVGAIILFANLLLRMMACLRRSRGTWSAKAHQPFGAAARFYGKSLLPGRTSPALDFSTFYEAR